MVANKVSSRDIDPVLVIEDLYRSIMGSDDEVNLFSSLLIRTFSFRLLLEETQ